MWHAYYCDTCDRCCGDYNKKVMPTETSQSWTIPYRHENFACNAQLILLWKVICEVLIPVGYKQN